MTVHYKNAQWNKKKVIIGESELNSGQPPRLLIGFHGADSTPENMLIHGNKLKLNNTVFVYPEGPADAGDGLWSWWQDGPRQKEAVIHFLNYTAQMVDAAHRHLKELTDHDPKVCMWGFSQGGAAALVYSLLGTQPLHKVASVCGFLPEIPDNDSKQTHNTTILGIYGLNDEVVPSFLAEHALDELESQGHRLTKKETSQGHEVNADNIMELTQFFESD
ncbi:MAG: dienelactone hydrolase family protein [Nitrospinota bacterium]|nr:dienelactone hydrolase family protein [Nitrospinota bacterium]